MNRNFITEAVILKTMRFGEIHKSVTLLSPDFGILQAIAHGALKMKSRLRSSTQPFYRVRAYIYHDPVKDSYKITDVETVRQCQGIAESVEKFYAASMIAEIILKSYGGGDSGSGVYGLVHDAIECLDDVGKQELPFVIIQFIYRYLVMTGYGPRLRSCNGCGKLFDDTVRVFFHAKSSEFLCGDCSPRDCVPVQPGMIKYLEKTCAMQFGKSMEIKVEKSAVLVLKKIMYALIEAVLEAPLASLRSGEGII